MSKLDIEAIKSRVAHARRGDIFTAEQVATKDAPALLAEVERLESLLAASPCFHFGTGERRYAVSRNGDAWRVLPASHDDPCESFATRDEAVSRARALAGLTTAPMTIEPRTGELPAVDDSDVPGPKEPKR